MEKISKDTQADWKQLLETKEAKLNKVNTKLDECGGFYADLSHDHKLANKRNKLKRDRSELMNNINDLKEIISEF
tara:strand:+ start:16225 stop:16449 length:225 start_codon:yes stop_codon:yes gene_type:complete